VQDEVLAVDGARATSRSIGEAVNARKPGDRLTLLVSHLGTVRELEVTLGASTRRAFRISVAKNPTPLQSAILASWLK
jgi:predicted metalloprotease with PDZ domain